MDKKISINGKISKLIPSVTAEVNQSVTLVCHNNYVNDSNEDQRGIVDYIEYGILAEDYFKRKGI